ncbi:methylated-DNA--[protein]-cysteine S-methyltransferase [Glaciecola sp. XM2]|jgi:methylated-DNA-[protein]-cysteine S-methyltransferase|uniref:methylated-DNA--[protein]-cysteine S-methyltransferase n=1 Tax=Glaciecola sp. XM2 TaxID=1914931 RepID=UPI001BDE80E6|nr:methylated-DNA--[protein]-cysteine S-methyltransferase [Glaciecola sp. XM2]MBT1451338.1 methylated-DNA--[protein]-cysteine S-methyltransferase [Glaciecola sp. XM2]
MMYNSQIKTPIGVLQIHANDTHIVSIAFADEPLKVQSNEISELGAAQLSQYFKCQRKRFSLPLKASGTQFQSDVWNALCDIDYGKTASYLDIATAIGNPKACRAVGAANGKNPIAIVVPCHRIIGANGALTGYAGGMHRKSYLLTLESR